MKTYSLPDDLPTPQEMWERFDSFATEPASDYEQEPGDYPEAAVCLFCGSEDQYFFTKNGDTLTFHDFGEETNWTFGEANIWSKK